MDSDFLLIQKMKYGDERSIEAFVKKYYPKILKYCCLHVSDYGYAEDMTQETFEQFFRTLDRYQHYGKALNYLYVIASHQCKDHYRRRLEPATEEVPDQLDFHMEHWAEWMDVRRTFENLPPDLKETAILYFVQQRKQREIAKILGIGLPLVKYRVRKARELLTAGLKKEE